MRNQWQLFSADLPDGMCDQLVSQFCKIEPADATVFNGDQDHRSSKVRWVEGEHGLRDILIKYVIDANANAFAIDIHNSIRELQFTEYAAEYQGHYDVHHDVDWLADNAYDRKLSIVIQLSAPEDYEGGEFSFTECENPPKDEFQKKGSILIFPSYLPHKVSPVTAGVRYSLVSWVHGPRWR